MISALIALPVIFITWALWRHERAARREAEQHVSELRALSNNLARELFIVGPYVPEHMQGPTLEILRQWRNQ